MKIRVTTTKPNTKKFLVVGTDQFGNKIQEVLSVPVRGAAITKKRFNSFGIEQIVNEDLIIKLTKAHNESSKLKKAAIKRMIGNQPPYDVNELRERKKYKTKFHVKGIGWVEVETETPFICNGLIKCAAEKILAGEYVKCKPPSGKERVIKI